METPATTVRVLPTLFFCALHEILMTNSAFTTLFPTVITWKTTMYVYNTNTKFQMPRPDSLLFIFAIPKSKNRFHASHALVSRSTKT